MQAARERHVPKFSCWSVVAIKCEACEPGDVRCVAWSGTSAVTNGAHVQNLFMYFRICCTSQLSYERQRQTLLVCCCLGKIEPDAWYAKRKHQLT